MHHNEERGRELKVQMRRMKWSQLTFQFCLQRRLVRENREQSDKALEIDLVRIIIVEAGNDTVAQWIH